MAGLRAGLGLIGRRQHEKPGFRLYGAAVAVARDPFFYRDLGVADTLDGRFDVLALHVFLLIRRLRALPLPGTAIAQAVFDAMFSDMDLNLREMGVGDLAVGKRVRAMWEALHGRASAYESAMRAAETDALTAALARNVWRGAAPDGAAARLALLVRAQDAHLAAQSDALLSGQAVFLPAAAATRQPST